jgi:2-hydroxymuconate-semialdehyde hydrolase
MSTSIDPSPDTAHTIDVNGIATNYHDQGQGAPVILIHGSGPGVTAWANWRNTIPFLAQGFRVIAPDILGFGYTERPHGVQYNTYTWMNHLVGLLDVLELERVSLVGNSFGGALALNIASKFPGRVDRLVLMGSVGVPFNITEGLDAVWGFEPSLPAMRRLLDIFAYDRSLVSDELAELRLAAATRPGVQEAFSAMFPAPRQQGVDALTVDEDAIAKLPHSTLIIHGRDDRVIPLSNSLRLHELIDQSQLHVFGRCGHWVQIEHASEFNNMLQTFLSSVAADE